MAKPTASDLVAVSYTHLDVYKRQFLNSVMPDTVYNSDKTDSATIPLEWK